MEQYPEYKDSGLIWIDKIPTHWNVIKLKRVSKIINGSTPKTTIGDYWNGDIDWITPNDLGKLNGKKFIFESERKISSTGLNSCGATITPKGSIILSTRAPIGHIAITGRETCTNQGCKTIILQQDKVSSSYLYYYLNVFRDVLESYGQGTTFTELSSQNLKDFKFVFPQLSEQEKIANFLDKKNNQINSLITIKQQQIDLLQENRSVLINQAVTRGLDKNVPLKDSGIKWIGNIPTYWKTTKIKYVCSVKGRIGYRGYRTEDLVEEGKGALSLGASHVDSTGQINLSSPVFISWDKYYESPEIMVSQNDVLVVQRGSCGNVGYVDKNIGPATINPSLVLLKEHDCNSKYLFYSLISQSVQNQIDLLTSKTAVPMLSQEQINNLYIAIPNLEEQNAIVNYLDNKLRVHGLAIKSVESQIRLLKEYKASLISSAVTGKIDVRRIG